MTVCFRYLPLYHELSTVSSSQEVSSTQYRDRNLWGCGHTGSNFGIISGQSKLFRDNQSFSRTIWAKADFRDPSGTQVRNPGLSRRFRDCPGDSGTVGNYAFHQWHLWYCKPLLHQWSCPLLSQATHYHPEL